MGRPCVFVRLTGCNLRCRYCDTRYAYSAGAEMEIADILASVAGYACQLVEVTGGEPLFQSETPRLIDHLLQNRYEVMLETNGSYDIGVVDPRCIKIVDIKCPSSGESQHNELDNLHYLQAGDQIKFVIGNRHDYLYARKILPALNADFPRRHILFSPVFSRLDPAVLADWILTDGIGVRLHLQLHKIIWPHVERGR